jgi:hypothetical protein
MYATVELGADAPLWHVRSDSIASGKVVLRTTFA